MLVRVPAEVIQATNVVVEMFYRAKGRVSWQVRKPNVKAPAIRDGDQVHVKFKAGDVVVQHVPEDAVVRLVLGC